MPRSPRFILPILTGLLWAGCTDAPHNSFPPDDSGTDAVVLLDGSPTDVMSADTVAADQSPADVAPADSPQADAPPTDDVQPDADQSDVTTPDVTTPDVTTPDAALDVVDSGVLDVVAPPDVPAITDRPDVLDAPAITDRPDVLDVLDAPAITDRPDVVDVAACTPTTEVCNGVDDDCDGIVDESSCGTHLLVTEVVVAPTEAEFIEVHNPTGAAVNLSNYYLSDTHDYACLLGRTCTITGRAVASLESSDFVVRFPDGVTIPAGGYVVVSVASPADFAGIHGGHCPDFYVPSRATTNDAGTTPLGACTAARPMRASPSTTSSIGTTAGLGNTGEMMILFRWDGVAALSTDVDYLFWGAPTTTNAQVDKSGTSVAGTAFLADTPAAMQQRVAAPATAAAAVRCDFAETGERRTGGNGVGGHDETSEPLATTWRTTTAATARDDAGLLTAVNATPGAINNCR